MLPCCLRRRKFRKSGCEMVYSKIYSKVYLNKYVVSIAPFSYPTFTPTPHAYSENWSFCMFSLFNFLSIFSGGQQTPFAPICGRPWFSAYKRPVATDAAWFVCACVSIGHNPELCQTGWTDRNAVVPFGLYTRVGLESHGLGKDSEEWAKWAILGEVRIP